MEAIARLGRANRLGGPGGYVSMFTTPPASKRMRDVRHGVSCLSALRVRSPGIGGAGVPSRAVGTALIRGRRPAGLVLARFAGCRAGRVEQDCGCDSVEREAGLIVQGTDSVSCHSSEQAEARILGGQVRRVQVPHRGGYAGLGGESTALGRARDRSSEALGCGRRQVPLHEERRAEAIRVAEARCDHARTLWARGVAPHRGNYATLVRPDHVWSGRITPVAAQRVLCGTGSRACGRSGQGGSPLSGRS